MEGLGKPTILAVEDDTAIQALLRAVLGPIYDLKIAGDGATAPATPGRCGCALRRRGVHSVAA